MRCDADKANKRRSRNWKSRTVLVLGCPGSCPTERGYMPTNRYLKKQETKEKEKENPGKITGERRDDSRDETTP